MMKFITTLFLLFLFYMSSAQQQPNRSTMFGVRAGLTYVNMNFNKGYPVPAMHISSTWKVGGLAGVMLQVRLTDKLSLQPEYIFYTASSRRNDSAITYHFTYLSFPLTLKYNFVSRLHFVAGAQFDLLIKAKKEGSTSINITHDTEERNIGITAGLEYLFENNLSISSRYFHGLNHVGIGQRSNLQEYKSQLVTVSVGYYF